MVLHIIFPRLNTFPVAAFQHATNNLLPLLRLRFAGEVGDLGGDDETSHGSGCQSGDDTRDESRNSQFSHITTTGRSNLSEDTNLNTQRADVAETAKGICGNESGARRQIFVVLVSGEIVEAVVFVLHLGLVLKNCTISGGSYIAK